MKRAMFLSVVALGLATVVVVGARDVSAGGGCHSATMTAAAGVSVDLTNRCFEPTVVRVQAGDTITWTNSVLDAHTVTGVAQSWGTYDELTLGESVSYQFDNSGVFPYFCLLHPSMVGAVVVGDGTAAAATGAGEGAKLVSAIAPVAASDSEQSAPESPAEAEDADDGVAVTLVAGAVLAAGLIGTSAGVAIGRRAKGGAS